MNQYEVAVLYHPDLEVDLEKATSRVEKIFADNGGKVVNSDNWGKRKLAYEVKKQLKGIYLYWRYLGNAGTVEEIERNLRMLDAVIRYYTVKVDEDVVSTARPETVDEEAFTKAASTVPDEEELVTGAAPMPRFGEDDDDIPDLDDDFPGLDLDSRVEK